MEILTQSVSSMEILTQSVSTANNNQTMIIDDVDIKGKEKKKIIRILLILISFLVFLFATLGTLIIFCFNRRNFIVVRDDSSSATSSTSY